MVEHTNTPKYSYYIVWSPGDREFAASFLELPGLSGMAATIPEAIEQLHEALTCWLEVAREKGLELPPPIQKDASVPLVVIDRSHVRLGHLITDTSVVLPAGLRTMETNLNAVTSLGNKDVLPDQSA